MIPETQSPAVWKSHGIYTELEHVSERRSGQVSSQRRANRTVLLALEQTAQATTHKLPAGGGWPSGGCAHAFIALRKAPECNTCIGAAAMLELGLHFFGVQTSFHCSQRHRCLWVTPWAMWQFTHDFSQFHSSLFPFLPPIFLLFFPATLTMVFSLPNLMCLCLIGVK